MDPFSVSKVKLNQLDANGMEVKSIYAKFDPRYAVYQTPERVTIQFADDPKLESEQRSQLAKLAPLRGEINGLVDGWRTARFGKFRSAALRYDRRVADTLIVALEGDPDSALLILPQVRDAVVAERKSYARFMYLLYAGAAAFLLGLAALGATRYFSAASLLALPHEYFINGWFAIAAGTLGAFFSIALGISGRSIQTDLQMLDNIIDAIVRVVIGAIAAVVLQALLDADLFSLHLGQAVLGAEHLKKPDGTPFTLTPPLVLFVAAFIAGFSERLIPDLLNSATIGAPDKAKTPAAVTKPDQNVTKKGDTKEASSGSSSPASATSALDTSQAGADEHVDGCDVDASNAGVPPTPDDRLPAASGGVAPSR